MENIWYILGAGIITTLASLSGLLVIKSSKKVAQFIETHLEPLSALSGGVFLFTSIAMAKHTLNGLELKNGIAALLIGILLFFIFHKFLTGHRHKGDSEEHIKEHKKKSALKIIIGDTIHNMADGLMLVASFAVNPVMGIGTAISTFLHEVPQEISEFIVLIKSGYSKKEAAVKNLISALSIFIGIWIGFFLSDTKTLQGFLIGISSAFFFGIIFTDLLPIKNIKEIKNKNSQVNVFSFIFGFIVMAVIMYLIHKSH
jgi:zinc and cadmium transporter